MRKDPLLLTCFRLAKEWRVSPWEIRKNMSTRELREWQTYYTYYPPAGMRIDRLIAEIRGMMSDEKSKRLKKYWPEYGPKTDEEIMRSFNSLK